MCGLSFKPKWVQAGRPARYCSQRCSLTAARAQRDANAAARVELDRTCEVCGTRFRRRRVDVERTCSWACFRQLVAPPTRHCVACGASFEPRGDRPSNQFCSNDCFRAGVRNRCANCGNEFSGSAKQKFCSRRCQHQVWLRANAHRNREYSQRRKARLRDAKVAVVDPLAVFERDGWICRLCGLGVDFALTHPDLAAATVDHVIPLSRGGTHEMGNVQLAHFSCNSRKGNRQDGGGWRAQG